jgi:hypothetical protein
MRRTSETVLPPGSYAYMQDVTKGVVKTYSGPTVINPTAQERPVIYDPPSNTFRGIAALEDAMRIAPIAAEGFYIILRNPARANKHPDEGSAQPAAELEIGRTIIVPGPATFALWPGQAAEVVEGHHLRSNQYLLVRVYNEDEARKNWSKAVVKPATLDGVAPADPVAAPPPDLTVGKQLIIRGTEVSFYIPPTGIEVVRDGAEHYAREALTLERLEYAILVDENGEALRGPQVVFPLPTERLSRRATTAASVQEVSGPSSTRSRVCTSRSSPTMWRPEAHRPATLVHHRQGHRDLLARGHSAIKYDGSEALRDGDSRRRGALRHEPAHRRDPHGARPGDAVARPAPRGDRAPRADRPRVRAVVPGQRRGARLQPGHPHADAQRADHASGRGVGGRRRARRQAVRQAGRRRRRGRDGGQPRQR